MSLTRLPHWDLKLFSDIYNARSAKRSFLQLKDICCYGKSLLGRGIGFSSANYQSIEPYIPLIDTKKHGRPYLPRRALM